MRLRRKIEQDLDEVLSVFTQASQRALRKSLHLLNCNVDDKFQEIREKQADIQRIIESSISQVSLYFKYHTCSWKRNAQFFSP